jgi:hypothetical protein
VSHRNRYTLDELLAQCDLSVPRSAEEQAWLDIVPVGREFGAVRVVAITRARRELRSMLRREAIVRVTRCGVPIAQFELPAESNRAMTFLATRLAKSTPCDDCRRLGGSRSSAVLGAHRIVTGRPRTGTALEGGSSVDEQMNPPSAPVAAEAASAGTVFDEHFSPPISLESSR